MTSQGALQVLKQKDEPLLQLCISEGRLVAMQVNQMGPGREERLEMREEAGRSSERSDGVLGWGTVGEWAGRMPLLTDGLRKGKGEGGMEMLRGSRLGHRALVAPPYHVTPPYFSVQVR